MEISLSHFPSSSLLHTSLHLSVFLSAPSSSRSGYGQPGYGELSVTLLSCSLSFLQWSMSEIYSTLSPTGRSFVLIWRHFLKERQSLLQSSASIKPWLWVRELTVPCISPSTRSRGKKDTGHALIFHSACVSSKGSVSDQYFWMFMIYF